MFCSKCGRENSDQNKFCNGCGNTLQAYSNPPIRQILDEPPPMPFENAPPFQTAQPETVLAGPEPQTFLKPWIIGIVVAAAILGLIGIGAVYQSSDKNRAQTQSNSVSNSVAQTSSKSTENKNLSRSSLAGMVFIPAGEFTMGRADGKSEAEKPAHKVTVSAFQIDVYETTNEQYAAFIKAIGGKPPANWANGIYPANQAKFHVVGVDWSDANAFAKWAGKRLPTEEEWEFAARGTSNYLYPWGNTWQAGNANAEGASQTFMEVGKSKGASPFGAYDMSGNAWEWTSSDFKAYPNGRLPDVFAGKTNLKTIRGGSFEATRDFATTTYRIGWAATGAENYSRTGFRCAKNVEE